MVSGMKASRLNSSLPNDMVRNKNTMKAHINNTLLKSLERLSIIFWKNDWLSNVYMLASMLLSVFSMAVTFVSSDSSSV